MQPIKKMGQRLVSTYILGSCGVHQSNNIWSITSLVPLHSQVMRSPLQKHLELNLRSCGVHQSNNIWSMTSLESTYILGSCGVHYRIIWSIITSLVIPTFLGHVESSILETLFWSITSLVSQLHSWVRCAIHSRNFWGITKDSLVGTPLHFEVMWSPLQKHFLWSMTEESTHFGFHHATQQILFPIQYVESLSSFIWMDDVM